MPATGSSFTPNRTGPAPVRRLSAGRRVRPARSARGTPVTREQVRASWTHAIDAADRAVHSARQIEVFSAEEVRELERRFRAERDWLSRVAGPDTIRGFPEDGCEAPPMRSSPERGRARERVCRPPRRVVTVRGDQTQTGVDDGPFRIHERLEERFALPADVDAVGVSVTYSHGAGAKDVPALPLRPRSPASRSGRPVSRTAGSDPESYGTGSNP